MYLNAFGQPIVFIQSLKAAYEILDKRANISSDRPRYIAAHEILCGGLFTASMPYGDLSVPPLLLKSRDLYPYPQVAPHSPRGTRRPGETGSPGLSPDPP